MMASSLEATSAAKCRASRSRPFCQRAILGNRRRADDCAVGKLDRKNGQRNVYEPPILRLPNRFVVIDPFAGTDASRTSSSSCWRSAGMIRSNRLAECRFGAVPKIRSAARFQDVIFPSVIADDRIFR